MATYTPLQRAAEKLETTADQIREFASLGWIKIAEKNGMEFVADNQEYKAKFILYLQRVRRFDNAQISKILAAQAPPYRLADIDRVLAASK